MLSKWKTTLPAPPTAPPPTHHSMEIAEAVMVVQTASYKISFQVRFIQVMSGNNCVQTGLLGQPILTLR